MTSNASQSDCRTEPLATTSTIISLNTETLESFNSGTNSPIIRFIKTERISPPIVETSFQSIAFSSDETDNNLIQSNDASNTGLEVTNEISAPLITRIKIERHSPTIVRNEIDITEEIDRNIDESSVVTSSRNNELNVEMSSNANQLIEDDRNEIECIFSGSPVMRSIKVERKSPTLELNQITENTECSSSSQQLNTNTQTNEQIQNRNDENVIDVQNIAYECFFSNEEQQQIQTFTSEATTSVITSDAVNNPMLEINAFTQNPNLTNEGITQVINRVNIEESGATYQQNVVNSSSLIASLSISNNVINSPIHSDEEYMLLGSPQQTGYAVTVGSDHNLGEDSIDEEMI